MKSYALEWKEFWEIEYLRGVTHSKLQGLFLNHRADPTEKWINGAGTTVKYSPHKSKNVIQSLGPM